MIIILSSCSFGPFSCGDNRNYQPVTEEQKLIYAILYKICTENGYSNLKKSNMIYIVDRSLNQESKQNDKNENKYVVKNGDIPHRIDDFKLCLKTKIELQKIADRKGDFMYLDIGKITINSEFGKIVISNWWQAQTNSKYAYLDGGITEYQFKKIEGNWVFDKITSSIMS